jgi:hypothetical protein
MVEVTIAMVREHCEFVHAMEIDMDPMITEWERAAARLMIIDHLKHVALEQCYFCGGVIAPSAATGAIFQILAEVK